MVIARGFSMARTLYPTFSASKSRRESNQISHLGGTSCSLLAALSIFPSESRCDSRTQHLARIVPDKGNLKACIGTDFLLLCNDGDPP